MAIIEFESGPQNYFELGYFDGDYTEANQSRTALTCEADRIVGFEFQAGFFFEAGYIEDGMFGTNSIEAQMSVDASKIHSAEISATEYYTSGYFVPGYIATQGMQGQFTVQGTRLLGEIAVTMVSFFDQTAVGNRNGSIDMFAFSDAAIAVTVDRLRDHNISAHSEFSLTADYVVSRSADADVDAIFSAIIAGLRSRDAELPAQAAFSFESTPTRILQFDSQLASDSAQSTQQDVLKGVAADLVVETQVTAQFLVVRDAHLTGTGVAAIICDAVKTSVAGADIAAQSTTVTNGGYRLVSSAVMTAFSSIFVSRYAGTDRPKTIVGTFVDGSQLLNSAQRITDLSPLFASSNWYYTTSINVRAAFYTAQSGIFTTVFQLNLGNEYVRGFVRYNNSQGFIYRLESTLGTPDFLGETVIGNVSSVFGATARLSVSFTGGQKLAFFINGIMIAVAQDIGLYGPFSKSALVEFAPNFPFAGTQSIGTVSARTDYAWLTLGNLTSSGTVEVPFEQIKNTDDTMFLYRFDGNGNEELSIDHQSSSTFTVLSTIQATLSGINQAESTLQSNFDLSSAVSVDRGADLVAFSESSLIATSIRIKSTDSNQSTTFTVITDVNTISTADADLQSTSDQITDFNVVRSAEINTDAVATNLAIVSKIGEILVDVNSNATVSVTAEKITDIESILASETTQTVSADRTRGITEDITSETALAGSVTRIKPLSSDITSEATVSAQARKDTVGSSTLASEFTVMADASGGTIRAIALLASLGDITVIPEVTRTTASALLSDVNTSVVAVKSVDAQADAPAQTDLQLDYIRFRSAQITTESIGTLLSVVVKTTDEDANLESVFSLVASGTITTGSVIPAEVAVNQTTVAVKITDVNSTIEAQLQLTAEGTSNIVGQSDLASGSTFTCQAQTTTETILSAFSDAAVTTTASVTRDSLNVDIAAAASMPAVVYELFVPGQSSLFSSTAVNILAGKQADSGQLDFASMASTLTVGRFINIDKKLYVIPRETRRYIINTETNTHVIGTETRIYLIRSTR